MQGKARNAKQMLAGAALLLTIITWLSFSPAVKNQFTNWDDDGEITTNPQVRSLSLDNIRATFAAPRLEIYHPLTTVSWALEYHFVGYNSAAFHRDNILLHILNTLLVLWLIYLLSSNVPIAFVTALLFSVHPLRVESVAWATERKDVLYAFFFLLALVSYLYYVKRNRNWKFYVAALLCMVLSAFAKGQAAALPLALIAFDFLLKRKLDWRAWVEKLPFFAASLIFGYIAILAQRTSGWVHNSEGLTFGHRAMHCLFAIVLYLEKIVVPRNLSAVYPHPATVSIAVPFICAAIVGLVIWSLKKTRKIAFGAGFFFATIVMVLPWIGGAGKFVAADRFTYIPSIGLSYVVADGFCMFVASSSPALRRWREMFYLALAALTITYVVATRARCRVWQDSYSLMSDIIEKYPDEPNAYCNRAMVDTDYAQAIDDYSKSILYAPSLVVNYNNRGLLYFQHQEYDKAFADFNEGIRRDPNYSNLYFNRMIYYIKYKKDYPRALLDMNNAERSGGTVPPKIKDDLLRLTQGH